MIKALSASVALAAIALAMPLHAETVAITGGRVVVGDGSPPVDGGTVVLRDGKVIAAGAGIAVPAGARTIDASGKWVTPGIFAGFSRVGLVEVEAVSEANDAAARRSVFSAALDVSRGFDPARSPIAINRAAGVTRAVVAPAAGSSIFAGQGAIADLGADPDAVTVPRAFQFVELGETGLERAGGSRPATHALLRAMLREAADFRTGRADFDDDLLRAEDARALLRVIDGEARLLIHAESAADIRQALALKAEFPKLKPVLMGASEGWLVAREIAAAGVPVIAAGLNDLPDAFERLAATQSNVGRMRAAGVTVALGLIGDAEAHQLRWLAQHAGNLVALTRVPGATGLSWDEAFASIAARPAEAMGVADRMGSLRPGRVGDVVIWDGDPLELASAPVTVFIDGVEQPLTNRQQKLRDRYRTPTEGALPKAYDR